MVKNNRQCIMVVDDDPEMLSLLNHTLETEGFDTIIVADGDSALNLLERIEPDLIVLDSTMPGMDDFQTLDLMRKQSGVPIIMLSSEYEMGSLKKALSHGADDYIRKPLSPLSFVARIRAKLRRARHQVLQI